MLSAFGVQFRTVVTRIMHGTARLAAHRRIRSHLVNSTHNCFAEAGCFCSACGFFGPLARPIPNLFGLGVPARPISESCSVTGKVLSAITTGCTIFCGCRLGTPLTRRPLSHVLCFACGWQDTTNRPLVFDSQHVMDSAVIIFLLVAFPSIGFFGQLCPVQESDWRCPDSVIPLSLLLQSQERHTAAQEAAPVLAENPGDGRGWGTIG